MVIYAPSNVIFKGSVAAGGTDQPVEGVSGSIDDPVVSPRSECTDPAGSVLMSCGLEGFPALTIGLFSIAKPRGVKLSGGSIAVFFVSALGACAAGMSSSPHHAGIGVCAVRVPVRGALIRSDRGISAVCVLLA
jgi:hypothetical protein